MTVFLYILLGLAIWTALAFPAAVLWGRRLRRVTRGQANKAPSDHEQHMVRLAR